MGEKNFREGGGVGGGGKLFFFEGVGFYWDEFFEVRRMTRFSASCSAESREFLGIVFI